MLSDEVARKLEEAVQTCNAARTDLEEVLEAIDEEGAGNEARLRSVAAALEEWRDAQRRFMSVVEASAVSDVSTAALLLKTNRGVDSANARRGLPGVPVEGTDQPFDVDLTGRRGTAVTTAAMEYVSPPDD